MESRIVALAALLAIAGGCASEPTQCGPGPLAMKDQEIQHLAYEVAKQRENAIALQAEADIANAKLAAKEEELRVFRQEMKARETEPPKALAPARPPEPIPAKGDPAPTPVSTARRWHLRIISLPKNEPNELAVREIAAHLGKLGVPEAVPRTAGEHWVVDIGAFPSSGEAEAQALWKRLTGLEYEGRRQFQSAYFVAY